MFVQSYVCFFVSCVYVRLTLYASLFVACLLAVVVCLNRQLFTHIDTSVCVYKCVFVRARVVVSVCCVMFFVCVCVVCVRTVCVFVCLFVHNTHLLFVCLCVVCVLCLQCVCAP